MQATAVVVAFQVIALERKMPERVRTVDENLDALLPSQLHDVADRQDLTGQIGDVRELDDLGPVA